MELKRQKLRKLNCWEFMQCGREAGGSKTRELGVCPVSSEIRLNKVHDGWNAGRACWVVAGSLCGGERQGIFANKFVTCEKCAFYQQVKQDEGGSFKLAIVLLNKLKEKNEGSEPGAAKTDKQGVPGRVRTVWQR